MLFTGWEAVRIMEIYLPEALEIACRADKFQYGPTQNGK